jgi:LPS export ABC transporter protein LptC
MRFLFFLVLIFVSCSNDPKLVQEFVSSEVLPIEKIEGAEMLHTENGKLKVKIVATTIERFNNQQPQLVFSNHLVVYFYNDSALVQSTLKAEYAEINDEKKLMTAKENVILTNITGKKLESEELIWDEKNNKIYTDKKVKITTGKEVIEGEGFVSNPDFTEYSISKIHGTFNFETPNE